MLRLKSFGSLLVCLCIIAGGDAYGQPLQGVGVRAGIGTDIHLGIAYGAEVNYTKEINFNALELGLAFFGGSFDEETDEGIHTYNEETTIFVVAALANYLFMYSLEKPGPYFVAGVGVGAISVEWEERSSTDTSLGPLLPGGGSMQSEEGSSAGTIVNFGIGHRFSENLDVRGQVPTLFIPSAPGDATSVVPTFTLTVGYRF
jgi:hypothetical protein